MDISIVGDKDSRSSNIIIVGPDSSRETSNVLFNMKQNVFPHAMRADKATRTSVRLHLCGHCASHASRAPNVGIFGLS